MPEGQVYHIKNEVSFGHLLAAALYAQGFYCIGSSPQAGRIYKPKKPTTKLHRILYSIAGGAWYWAHNGPVFA